MEDLTATPGVPGARWIKSAAMLLLAILPGCSNFVGTTAKSFMSHIRSDPDPNKRYLAYAGLGKRDLFDSETERSEAVDLLIAKLKEGREPLAIRSVICRTLGDIRDPKARTVLIKTAGDPEGILRAEACRAIGKIGNPEDASLLARVMTVDNLEDCRMAAIEGLGEMKVTDPRIIQILIDGMDHDDPAIRMASLTSLRKISGKDLGVETEPWRKHFEPLLASANPNPSPTNGPGAASPSTTPPTGATPTVPGGNASPSQSGERGLPGFLGRKADPNVVPSNRR
jgi:hypothetical protein